MPSIYLPALRRYPYLALTTPDRSRFYTDSQYYGGVRIKVLDPAPASFTNTSNVPAYFDITIGQNAAFRTGALEAFVWRFDLTIFAHTKTPVRHNRDPTAAFSKNTNDAPFFISVLRLQQV